MATFYTEANENHGIRKTFLSTSTSGPGSKASDDRVLKTSEISYGETKTWQGYGQLPYHRGPIPASGRMFGINTSEQISASPRSRECETSESLPRRDPRLLLQPHHAVLPPLLPRPNNIVTTPLAGCLARLTLLRFPSVWPSRAEPVPAFRPRLP